MTRLLAGALATAVLLAPSVATAQSPLMDSVKAQFGSAKDVLLKTAAKVPEPIWAFRPTPDVRTFAQMHLPEIRCELRLLIAAACHVGMRRHHLAPRSERAGTRRLDQ